MPPLCDKKVCFGASKKRARQLKMGDRKYGETTQQQDFTEGKKPDMTKKTQVGKGTKQCKRQWKENRGDLEKKTVIRSPVENLGGGQSFGPPGNLCGGAQGLRTRYWIK